MGTVGPSILEQSTPSISASSRGSRRGHDLREYDLGALRGNMGVIFQDFVRYNLRAADNIAVGRIEARDDRARIERAASRSQADEVIAKLPAGYDQMIGKRFRNGVELSGGEWQKIAIARLYARSRRADPRRADGS